MVSDLDGVTCPNCLAWVACGQTHSCAVTIQPLAAPEQRSARSIEEHLEKIERHVEHALKVLDEPHITDRLAIDLAKQWLSEALTW